MYLYMVKTTVMTTTLSWNQTLCRATEFEPIGLFSYKIRVFGPNFDTFEAVLDLVKKITIRNNHNALRFIDNINYSVVIYTLRNSEKSEKSDQYHKRRPYKIR